MENLFEIASRLRPVLRFETPRGLLTTEDLWDLPLTSTTGKPNLDDIAKALYQQDKQSGEVVSFVDDTRKTDPRVAIAFEIVKRVIAVKKAENAEKLAADQKAARKQQLLGLLVQKENEQLSAKSIDEIKAELATL